jgi:hypothetical protein
MLRLLRRFERSANGLHRALMLGLRLLANDTELQAAIRRELERHEPEPERRGQDREPTLASLQQKPRKLLDLH